MKRTRIEYVWLDGTEPLPQLRSKARYLPQTYSFVVEDWNFDGGSTNQGSLSNSDRKLVCVRTYKDPFHEDGLLALCEVHHHSGVPHETNTRAALQVESKQNAGILVGFEQEFTLLDKKTQKPLGLSLSPKEQGQYYCAAGSMNVIGRPIIFEFEKACKDAGIDLDGINAEVMPGQWEFQTKAQHPLKASDDLWISRYILERISESYPVTISYDPKPHSKFNGAGCHTNFSTYLMRDKFDENDILNVTQALSEDHSEHMQVCGEGFEKRLTGECETASYKKFTSGVGDRGASVRIPEKVSREGKGYFEDRRPCANIDPYKVVYSLISSVKKSLLL